MHIQKKGKNYLMYKCN